ncbi:MAG: hypothetical protein ACKOEX_04860 [Planctomycetia bacterium]
MNRDELLDLCERYVRRRGRVDDENQASHTPPLIEIIDGYLHAEISENEKNSLLAYVRGASHDAEDDDPVHDLDEAVLAELDDVAP